MTTFRQLGIAGLVAVSVVAGACSTSGSSNSSTTSSPSSSEPPPTAASTSSSEAPPSSSSSIETGGGNNGSNGAGGGGGASSGTISSVVFTGTTLAPTVTVNGTGFGSEPSHDPTYTPEGTQLCPLPPSGNEGYNFGTNLFIYDANRNWAGGRYRPSLGELDCVGSLVSKFTPTQVVFQFGSAYAQYQQKDNYLLAEGDSYQLAVNGATFSGTVHYT